MNGTRFRLARLIAVAFLSAPAFALAKLSGLGQERFASYLTFSDSPSTLGQKAVLGESSATDYTDSIRQNISGEFGFVYAVGRISWRFGFEIVRPSTLTATAKDASGTKLYDVTSTMLVFLPKVGLEYNLRTTNDGRFYASAAVGSANLQLTNDYSNVTIAPNAAFSLKEKASGAAWSAGLGFEWVGFDATSLVFEAGYRRMQFGQLIYGADVTDFTGAKATGDAVNLTSGERRRIDLSGAYLAAGFRWWLF